MSIIFSYELKITTCTPLLYLNITYGTVLAGRRHSEATRPACSRSHYDREFCDGEMGTAEGKQNGLSIMKRGRNGDSRVERNNLR